MAAARLTRLQDRIVVFVVLLLAGVEILGFFVIRYAIQTTAQDAQRQQLVTGANVLHRLIGRESRELVARTTVVASDFGFREALDTHDRATIVSAFDNHAARMHAAGMAVVSLAGVVTTDSLQPAADGKPYAFPELLERAAIQGAATGVRVVGGKPYQVAVVPVASPLPIAWISTAFPIDDAVAHDLRALTGADVSYIDRDALAPRVMASSLPELRRRQLEAGVAGLLDSPASRTGVAGELGGVAYEFIALRVDDNGNLPVYVVLQRATSEVREATLLLETALFIIAGLSLAATLAGAMRMARRVTLPVTRLGEAAREIGLGNYSVRVGGSETDEIGELGRAFDRMAEGLEERDRMRDVLGKVASGEVVSELLDGRIELGGEEREVSVMFVDIRNFTGLVERLQPQQSLAMLNTFLTVVSEVIERHGGVVDKYLGDGAMAIFGAPVTRPDDARRAMTCALEIRDQVAGLEPVLAASGLPHPQLGIGVNTSRVIAGNIGSPTRLNYTVLGDGVNVASRLEGLTRRYDVAIVVGESTRDLVRDVVCRELETVRVLGRQRAERVFEPLGLEGSLTPREVVTLARWHEALEMFRLRCWDAAESGMRAIAREPGYARLTSLYLEYIPALRENPPGEGWDAALTLGVK